MIILYEIKQSNGAMSDVGKWSDGILVLFNLESVRSFVLGSIPEAKYE